MTESGLACPACIMEEAVTTNQIKQKTQNPFLVFTKKVLPWLIGLGIIAFIFVSIDKDQLIKSLIEVNVPLLLGIAVIYMVFNFILDSYSLYLIFHYFTGKVNWQDIRIARGVSYLVAVVNYTAGQGILPIYLKKKRSIPFMKGFSLMLFQAIIDMFLLLGFAFVVSIFAPSPVSKFIFIISAVLYSGLILNIIFWSRHVQEFFHGVQLGWLKKAYLWLINSNFGKPFADATVKRYLEVALFRFPLIFCILTFMYIALYPFNIQIGLLDFMLKAPIVLLFGALPITPAGLGTTQLAIIALFKGYSNTADLFAYSLCWPIIINLSKLLIGLFYVRQTSKDMLEE